MVTHSELYFSLHPRLATALNVMSVFTLYNVGFDQHPYMVSAAVGLYVWTILDLVRKW